MLKIAEIDLSLGVHIIDELRLRTETIGRPGNRDFIKRKRFWDHPGLGSSAAPAIEKYLDHPGLGSSAAPVIEKYLDHPVLGATPPRLQRIPEIGTKKKYVILARRESYSVKKIVSPRTLVVSPVDN
ncbi:hypothetical protein TNIN_410211 [Trichonephila inaurata madagascariensis]|uniref:Uncharacterized protein n=1 Tax=Trichonephila inaurata madagascariensis TaxID=2747483 RepID=A0A8X6YDX2_9ARAC|nr:hypothetical protein TNIN_410211 [Trichonephila inaurata madagascariensis]